MPKPFRTPLAASLIIFLVFSVSCAQEPAAISGDVSLGTVYYLGYGWDVSGPPWDPIGGLGSQGWNDITGNTLWSGFVTTRPEIGFYHSGDVQTITWQLKQMEEAGIQFVMIAYMGWGDADLDGVQEGYLGHRVHDAALLVLESIRQNDIPIQFALMVEPFMEHWSGGKLEPEDVRDEQRQMILDRLWEDFYRPYADLAYKIDGKPLIAAAERFSWGDYEDSQGRYEQRNIVWHHELAPFEDWSWVAVNEPPTDVFSDGTVFVWPRFDEWALWLSHGPGIEDRPFEGVYRMDPFLEEGAYDQGRKRILGRRSDVDRVIVWSWNSWADKVYIEPDSNSGFAAHGDLLTRKTAYYYRLLASGLPFKPMNPDWARTSNSWKAMLANITKTFGFLVPDHFRPAGAGLFLPYY